MKYVLDTHILLWWFGDIERLPRKQRDILEDARAHAPLLIADISLWEVATLVELGRVSLDLPLQEWLDRATAAPLVQRLGISPAVAAQVATLPPTFHRDPADRIIVATTKVGGPDCSLRTVVSDDHDSYPRYHDRALECLHAPPGERAPGLR